MNQKKTLTEGRLLSPDIALDLRYLDCIICIAERGSFRRAADILNISQSTLSRRVHLLEHRLGLLLFERTRTGAVATDAGAAFIREATTTARHFRQELDNISNGLTNTQNVLRVGTTLSLTDFRLSCLLNAFRDQHHGVEIRFEEAKSANIAESVRRGHLDVAFVTGRPILPECEALTISTGHLYAILPQNHRLADLSEISISDVRDEIFIISDEEAGPYIDLVLRRYQEELRHKLKISRQRVGIENLIFLVSRGFGLTIIASAIRDDTYPDVISRPLAGLEGSLPLSILWRRTNDSPVLHNLVQLAKCRMAPRKLFDLPAGTTDQPSDLC